MRMYYANVGTFNSFLDEMISLKSRKPQILFEVRIIYYGHYQSLKVIKHVRKLSYCDARARARVCVCVCVCVHVYKLIYY